MRKGWAIAAVVVGVAVVAIVLIWFQPQKLVMDDVVSEDLPGVVAAAPEPSASSEPNDRGDHSEENHQEPELTRLLRGGFAALAHDVEGEALVLETSSGNRYLRFEDFEVENGPDLRVYLSSAEAGGDHSDDFVDLGALKGNIGAQNYEIPSGVELDRYDTAVIWCRRFSVGFAAATLR